MSKGLSKFSPSIPPIQTTSSYVGGSIVQRNGDTQVEEVHRALGVKTIEEKISEIIKQSSSLDFSFIPFEKKWIFNNLVKEAAKQVPDSDAYHRNMVTIFNRLIALDSERPWAHFDRGQSLMILGRYEEAALDFTRELELHKEGPGVFRSYFERTWCNLEMDKVILAVQDFNKYKEFDTNQGIDKKFVTNLQSRIEKEVDKFVANAREKFQEADNLKFVESNLSLEEQIAYKKDQYLVSLKLFNQLVECMPERPWVHYDRGLNLMRLSREKEAILDFEKELEINQSEHCQKICRYEKGMAHFFYNDYQKAKPEFETLLQIQGESQDRIFEVAKKNLDRIEKFEEEKTPFKEEKAPDYGSYLNIAYLYFISSISLALILECVNFFNQQQGNVGNGNANLDHFRDEKEAAENVQFFSRSFLDTLSYENLVDHLVENFHQLPEDFFHKIIKLDNVQDLKAFLDEQQFLTKEIKDGLLENFEAFKKFEKDQLPKPSQFRFPKNYLRDCLLKKADSEKHPNDPVRMAEGIRNFEETVSKEFQKICENLLRDEKIKPLLKSLVVDVEDLLIAPAKDSNKSRPEVISDSSELEIPSNSPLKNSAEPKFSSQANLKSGRSLG